ncbi:MAG: CesT family type III secretion system chaperone, partial [Waddliaceae bacterium]|nr:CesT family type III secretion system chaperone [Waddliaceae bacterium]
ADTKIKLKLYEKLLEGSMLGGQMAGGGIGVAVNEELVLMHCTLDMAHAIASALRAFAPLYVETIEKWRKVALDISEGREPEEVGITAPGGGKPSAGGLGGGHPGIKI